MLWVALMLVAVSVNANGIHLDSGVFEERMEELRQPKYHTVTMEVSAYTAHEGGALGAWGKELAVGDCASDDLPQGTVVVVNGKSYVVNDCFGGGYIGKLDLYYGWDLDGALEFGRKTMEVMVIQ